MYKKIVLSIIICVALLPACAFGQEDLVSVGLFTGLEFKTLKLQALSGEWNVNLYPMTQGTERTEALQKIYREVNTKLVSEYLIPGEDVSVLLVAKGIVARVSSEKDVDKGFESVVFEGGDYIILEIPNQEPMLLEGIIQIDIDGENLSIINTVKLENLVVSLASLLSEMTSEVEAVKALTIVARTKLLHLLSKNPHTNSLYEICNESHCMPFKGCGVNRDMVKLLAQQTQGQVLSYGGKLIMPRYQDTCGGVIASAQEVYGVDNEPYHRHLSDILDDKGTENCYHSPNFHWSTELKKADFMDFIAVEYAGGIVDFYPQWEVSATAADGRVLQVLLRGRLPRFLPGHGFLIDSHKHFGENGLKSMRFKITEQLRSYLFHGMGKGAGVGMCLYGVDGMAKKGEKAEDILRFYYPGTEVRNYSELEGH
jgi:stage II sporulation protein D